jgi:hypothetical protein
MKSKVASGLLGVTMLLWSSTAAFGAEAAVLRVVVVETGDADAYVKQIEQGKALLKRLDSSGVIRVWRARFAGPNAGNVVVSVEYPSIAAFAKDDSKIAADSEYQAWLKGLDKLRKVVSDSLYGELKP